MWPFERSRSHSDFSGIPGAVPMFAAGAAAMYYLDPERGRRRRALLRDKFKSAYTCSRDSLRKTAQYTGDRTRGLVAEARAGLSRDDADDITIRERVRSAIGRAVSHPGSIQVSVMDGAVTLSGPVLAEEHADLLATARSVRGVQEVRDMLDVHETPGDVPGLQGLPRRSRLRALINQDNWDPLTRSLATIGGAGLALWGLARRDTLGVITGAAGLLIAGRGISNLSSRRMAGLGVGPFAIDVQKTITIHAPRDQVFDFFASYENFPHFMRNVREVRAYGDTGRSHWVVAGPAGVPVSWDAELLDFEDDEMLAWCSLPGATVENCGVIRFSDEAAGTRVDIKLSYNPPAGALGHAVARLFGSDPKSEMDEDLVRVKTTLETGNPPHDAAQPLRQHEPAEAGQTGYVGAL